MAVMPPLIRPPNDILVSIPEGGERILDRGLKRTAVHRQLFICLFIVLQPSTHPQQCPSGVTLILIRHD